MPRNAATQNNNTENMEQQVPFKVTITEHNPERGVLANADVNVAGIMTIRNVKIKQDDYGLTVTMPRTKMPHTEQYKDSVYFADKSMKQQFDMAVETSYQESVLTPVLDQDEPEEGMEQEESAGKSISGNALCRAEEKKYLSGIPHRKNVSVRTWHRRESGTGSGVVFQGGSKGT